MKAFSQMALVIAALTTLSTAGHAFTSSNDGSGSSATFTQPSDCSTGVLNYYLSKLRDTRDALSDGECAYGPSDRVPDCTDLLNQSSLRLSKQRFRRDIELARQNLLGLCGDPACQGSALQQAATDYDNFLNTVQKTPLSYDGGRHAPMLDNVDEERVGACAL